MPCYPHQNGPNVDENSIRFTDSTKSRSSIASRDYLFSDSLGAYVDRQRAMGKTMSVERTRKLDEIGFVWNEFDAKWEEGFLALKIFAEGEQHCRVPVAYVVNSFPLGRWVNSQRTKKNTMSEDRRHLNRPGFRGGSNP